MSNFIFQVIFAVSHLVREPCVRIQLLLRTPTIKVPSPQLHLLATCTAEGRYGNARHNSHWGFSGWCSSINETRWTIESVNPAYEQLPAGRDINGLRISEVFGDKNVDELIRVLKTATRDAQSLNTGPILAGLDGKLGQKNSRFVHTVVPISDASGSTVIRLFVYSEKTQ